MKDEYSSESPGFRQIAIIGTGPVSLLKALLLAKTHPNAQITLFDSAAITGGAWYSEQSPKGHSIECGCHIWSYVPKSYRFIEKELGVKLYPVKPNPVFVGARIKLPYSVKNTIDSYKQLFKTLFLFRWNKISELNNDPNMNFRFIGKRNRYPLKGSPELIQVLEEKVRQAKNIRFLLNTSIVKISVNETVKLISESQEFEFDRVYPTYVSNLQEVELKGESFPVSSRRVDYIHFLVQGNKPLLKKINYWRLINDPIIHRITDISYQTGGEENLFLVGIKDKSYYSADEETLMNHVRKIFLQFGLTDSTFELDSIKTHIFPTFYLQDETLTQLKKYPEKISLMHTTDLMHGIYFLLQQEKTI